MLLSDILELYIKEQSVKNNSAATIEYYKKRITYFINSVGDKNIKDININDYNNYVLYLKNKKTSKGLNLSSATIKTSVNAVKIFLCFCYKKHYTDINFTEIKPYKMDKKTIVILSDKEIQILLNSQCDVTTVGVRNLLTICLMLDAGLRVSEVCNLNVEDINEDLNLIKVFGKGHKERLVPLTPAILDYYKKYIFLMGINSGALLLNFETNERLTPSGISQILRRIKKKCGFKKLHPHYLRHTFATKFLINGGDPIHLQLILGHTSLYMTEQYLHLANQMTLADKSKFSPLSNIQK